MAQARALPLPFAGDLADVVRGVPHKDWAQLRHGHILLTGGTGFVGKWLLASLLEANRQHELGCRATVLTRNPDAFAAQMPQLANAQGVRLVQGDVIDCTLPEEELTHVIHAATDVVAQNSPLVTYQTCVQGTQKILENSVRSGASRMLLVSSGAVYGRQPPTVEAVPEDYVGAPDPMSVTSAYGEGKRGAELLCAIAASNADIIVPVARCFAFVGPYLALDKHFAIGNFIDAVLSRRPIEIQGDGTALRTYLYATDMVTWLWTILFRGQSSRSYNVGGAEALSIHALARQVASALGVEEAVHVAIQSIPGAQPERYVPDISRSRNELGVRVTVPIDEAIRRTAHWHMDQVPRSG